MVHCEEYYEMVKKHGNFCGVSAKYFRNIVKYSNWCEEKGLIPGGEGVLTEAEYRAGQHVGNKEPKDSLNEPELSNEKTEPQESSSHVGPIMFEVDCVFDYLEKHGVVYTVRGDRTVGNSWCRRSLYAPKEFDVRIEKVGAATLDLLGGYWKQSGFISMVDWLEKLDQIRGNSEGFLYRVTKSNFVEEILSANVGMKAGLLEAIELFKSAGADETILKLMKHVVVKWEKALGDKKNGNED